VYNMWGSVFFSGPVLNRTAKNIGPSQCTSSGES